MSKLGLHIHSWNHAIFVYCKTVGGAVHIILDHNEMMVNEVKRAQPKSLLIARLWVPEQKLDNPIKNAQDFTDLLLLYMDGCDFDGATGYNEWDGDLMYCDGRPGGKEVFERYADFEAERSRILHREGLLSVVGGCSVGTPPEHWFEVFRPALEEGDFLHLHEYSAPAMWDAENWHCLKYRAVYRYLKEHGLPQLPLIISECGIDGGVVGRPREGWRKFGITPWQYMAQWEWYDEEMMKDWFVVGSAAFDCGGGGGLGWASFNMDPQMLRHYADRIRALGVSHWDGSYEPGGDSMGVWEQVNNHRPDVAVFAYEIGGATKEHHVPIPDYQGQPVSPAKVLTVVIANEKNPCDPSFVNEFEEKDKDGKPTGRMLHAVGLCGVVAEHTAYTIEELKDPFVNIKMGLRILEGKLHGVQGNLREAYYLYTGGPAWEPKGRWLSEIWLNRFCSTYKLFWGVDLATGVAPETKILLVRIAELETRQVALIEERVRDRTAMIAAVNELNKRIHI